MRDPITVPNADACAADFARLHSELADVKRRLEQAGQELDAFAYSVSHDLRAPLRTINGFSKLLNDEARGLLRGDAADYLARIVGATQRMDSLLEDLLTLSRAGRTPLQVELLDAGAIARQIAASLDAREPGRQVSWQIADLRLEGDAVLMRKVIEQLLDNAFKFTRSRECASIALIAEQSAADPPGAARGFSIRDSGVGFDMRYAERLFAPFQRLHPASAYEGNGIGLALVQRILRRHGGHVRLQAAPDQGAQAFVRLWEFERPPSAGG